MKPAKAVATPNTSGEISLKDKLAFTFIIILALFWITQKSFNQEYEVKIDCLKAISKIEDKYGEIPSYVQWTRFSSFTHQGQCSEYIP
jgi:hypothetical protein